MMTRPSEIESSVAIAFAAMKAGENAPVALNAANEVAVESFLEGRLGFDRIPRLVGDVMDRLKPRRVGSLDDVLAEDREARREAIEMVNRGL